MEGKRLIEKIRLRNILSFGDKGEEIELQPLNVLIGPNASGKSNFIDVLKLLRALPQDKGLVNYISRNGGISEWIWKGKNNEVAEIDISFEPFIWSDRHDAPYNRIYLFEIRFADRFQRIQIEEEKIECINLNDPSQNKNQLFRNIYDPNSLQRENSILNFTRNYKTSEISYGFGFVIDRFSTFTVFSDLRTNRRSSIRKPQVPDAPNDFLEEDGSNLALVLNDLEHRGDTKDEIVLNLKKFNPRIKDYSIRILGGTVQLFIREEGLEKPISAMRLSDGTLRYLCLLAILCHPEPPPLICIEEPETGLHPDILPTIGELLIEASKRTQLIVTTHSDILVSSFSEVPEAVLVCEADEDGTHLNRLDGEKLKGWLKKYQLGDLWIRGEIGGTRW